MKIKNMKKLMSIILTAVILLSFSSNFVYATETKFLDVPEDAWYREAVEKLVESGIVNGVTYNTFCPEGTLTVEQLIKLAVLATGEDIKQGTGKKWAQPFINYALDKGLVLSGEFDSYIRPITRGEIARILVRCMPDVVYPDNYVMYQSMIKDFGSTSDFFREYILKAFVSGLMEGYPDKSFMHQNNATRAEAVTMIRRLMHRLIDQVEITVPAKLELTDADGFIIPDLRIVYYFSIGIPRYYDIFLNNYEKYLGKNYKFKIECINYPGLNVREQKWGKKWLTSTYNTLRAVDSIEEVEGAIYRQFDGWYLDRNKALFEYEVGMKIQFKITLDNGNMAKCYYVEGVIQDREFL